jgi:hypothetical protein
LGNLSTPTDVQKLPMASHAKDGVRSCPRAGCGKSACPVRRAGCGNGATAGPLRHRQTKGAATDMLSLTPPRHISTLRTPDGWSRREADVANLGLGRLSWGVCGPCGHGSAKSASSRMSGRWPQAICLSPWTISVYSVAAGLHKLRREPMLYRSIRRGLPPPM